MPSPVGKIVVGACAAGVVLSFATFIGGAAMVKGAHIGEGVRKAIYGMLLGGGGGIILFGTPLAIKYCKCKCGNDIPDSMNETVQATNGVMQQKIVGKSTTDNGK